MNWKISDADARVVWKIVCRAARQIDHGLDCTGLGMDLTQVHLNGCPLRLRELLNATPASFAHDVIGVKIYLDRATGNLRRPFRPYCAIYQEGGGAK